MEVSETKFKNVLHIIPDTFEDYRGKFVETFNKDNYKKIFNKYILEKDNSINELPEFIQDNISTASVNVLRGIHGDFGTWKLVSCIKGKVYAVIVDCRVDSTTYLQWEGFMLTESNGVQLLLPPGIGNSYLALTDDVIYTYKQTTNYKDFEQFSLKWNDSRLNIYWPLPFGTIPILSDRDRD